jgi:drug/metabolite transporter (DMT)-like permease
VQGVSSEERATAAGVSASIDDRAGASAAPATRPDAARAKGIAFIVASALAFGAMAIMARAAYADGVDTRTLLALRFAIAAACLFAIARIRGVAMPRGRELAAVAMLGGIGYGAQAGSFFTALTLAPAGLVALLLYLHPALVAVLAAVFLRERLSTTKLVALAIALAGMTATVAPALGETSQAFPRLALGVGFGLAAAAIYAVYIVVGTRLASRVDPLALAAIVAAAAAAVFVAAVLAGAPRWPRSGSGWLAIAGIAIVSTVAAITLFFAGLARVGPTQASTLSTIEPVFTVLLAALVLGETIAPVQLAGGALILAAVVLLARAPSQSLPAATGTD